MTAVALTVILLRPDRPVDVSAWTLADMEYHITDRLGLIPRRMEGSVPELIEYLYFVRDGDHRRFAELDLIAKAPETAAGWRGALFCSRPDASWDDPATTVRQWGEHGLLVPPFVFFGDKAIIGQLRELFHVPAD
jgi:hypothetical protein